ncbi:MAG: Amidohydrolase [Candidatus Tokpelaia hoelldobleri]|uniref:Amidohydrolase n=1 Tax=Candidatus Tokpelaia hoelldobleri TaxID=1902579 RepID=A0A1U9JTZ8_9HYPH|nr:MAG: Amidohydrolase [Candidatus Tokpelaia hoelldoblerii]
MLKRLNIALAAVAITAGTMTAAQAADDIDVIVLNADIRTVDAAKPRAEALAVKDGKFIAVGSSAYIKSLGGEKTRIIDAGGRTLIPGIADAHTHLLGGADLLRGVDLYGLKDISSWQAAIKKRAAELPEGAWLVGGRWEGIIHMPTKEELDSVVPDRPVALLDLDSHTLWVNSKVLELTGITAKTKAPAGGEIVRDSKGEPTGVLKESAMGLVFDHAAFAKTKTSKAADYEQLARHFNSVGVTSVHDMWDNLGEYEDAWKNSKNTLRVWFGLLDIAGDREVRRADFTALAAQQKRINKEAAEREAREAVGPKFRFGYLKYFSDGALSGYTAALKQPYADREDGFAGQPVQTQAHLNAVVTEANRAGFPVAIHAIGDKGVDMALDAFAQSPYRDGKLNRIEHIEVASKEILTRFGREGVVAAMMPDHAMDGDFQEKRLGEARLPDSYAWQAILSNGGLLVFGTDWPTAKESPLLQLGDAVLRIRNGKTWYGENALTFDEALYAYTQAPAIVAGWEKELGSISVGKWADFVILQGKVQDNPMTDIRDWKVDQTWFAGQKVFDRLQ